MLPVDIGVVCDDDAVVCLSAADLYNISDVQECGTVEQFRIKDGDRLIGLEAWSSNSALRAANGDTLFLERANCDPEDLVMTFMINGQESSIRLDSFFAMNPEFDDVSTNEALSDEEAVPILRAILQRAPADDAVSYRDAHVSDAVGFIG